MHPVVLLRFIIYFFAIVLHSLLAIVVGVLTHKGLLEGLNGNHAAIAIGAIWTVVLIILITCDLTRKPGDETSERRWVVHVWSELNVFFHLMFWELLFCGLNMHTDLTLECKDDSILGHNPCTFRPLIFGLWWSAAATVTLYFWSLLLFGFVFVADLNGHTTVRDYYGNLETRGEAYLGSNKGTDVRSSDLEGAPKSFGKLRKEGERPPISVPQAAYSA